MSEHEVIYGPTGSGKSYTARQRIKADIAAVHTQPWVIDYSGTDLVAVAAAAAEYAATPATSKTVLFAALGHAYLRAQALARLDVYDFDQPGRHSFDRIAVTIEHAHRLLGSKECVNAMQDLLRLAGKTGITVRLVVPDLQLSSFGDSEFIRAVMAGGTVTECTYGQGEPAEKEFVTL